VYLIFCQLRAWFALLLRSEASKAAEILALRHQVSVNRALCRNINSSRGYARPIDLALERVNRPPQ
jgi:hypothetical protein